MMQEIHVEDWEDFERQIKDLRQQYAEQRALVFRGLGDSTWHLTTTLERQGNDEMPFADYYRVIAASQPPHFTIIFGAATFGRSTRHKTCFGNSIFHRLSASRC